MPSHTRHCANRKAVEGQRRKKQSLKVPTGQPGPLAVDDLGCKEACASCPTPCSNGDHPLEQAEARGELRLHFQPRIDIRTGRIVSAEALLRWERDGHLVPPDSFIPLAESTGMIRDIGAWVIAEACRNCSHWQQIGLAGLPVSVNVSAVQFRSGDLEGIVAEALRQAGLSPSLLEIELTESRAFEDEDIPGQIARIAATGVRIAIDDFGTGYSNLARIGLLDVQTLKIDKVFVDNMQNDPKGRTLLSAIVDLSRRLGLKAVVEGVETQEVAAYLVDIGCAWAQGYLWSRPLPPGDFERLALAFSARKNQATAAVGKRGKAVRLIA